MQRPKSTVRYKIMTEELRADVLSAFEEIDALTPKYIKFWEDVCNLEGMAKDKDRMDQVADFVESFAKEQGFAVKRTPFELCGDFLTVDINEGAEKGYVFLAHLDTVHEYGKFGYPPVTVDLENDIMRGPGVIDCKGGAAVAMLLMEALKKQGYEKNLRLIMTSDEEISNKLGGEKEMDFIRDAVTGFRGALNCEVSDEGTAVVSRSGIMRCNIQISGKASHAGINYFEGISAVREAAYKILELETASVKGGTTYNCGIIHGGELGNIVPKDCSVIVDIRVHSMEAMDEAWKFINEVTDKSFVEGSKSELTLISRRLPMMRTKETDELFETIRSTSVKYGLGDLEPVESGGGSDSAYTQAAGVPSVCALGTCGDFCHTDKEFARISSLPQRAKMLAAVCVEH